MQNVHDCPGPPRRQWPQRPEYPPQLDWSEVDAADGVPAVPADPDCTCGSDSPRAFNHAANCPHSTPWNERVQARIAAGVQAVDRVQRLMDACEGEAGGLALTRAAARRILAFVDGGTPALIAEAAKLGEDTDAGVLVGDSEVKREQTLMNSREGGE